MMDDMNMSMSSWQPTNMSLARIYWYIIAGIVGMLMVVRGVNYYQNSLRLRTLASSSQQFPTKPANGFLQAWATLTAVGREVSYPQLYVPVRYLGWLTPPPAGRVLILLVYWSVIIGFMTAGSIVKDVNFWERIGFRNAWVTVTQLPLLYLLAGKSSVIGTLTGSSHERLNWLHRWVARTMFVTASVHGWHFYSEYAIADMTNLFFETMPMGKYGVAAWALLLWAFISGIAPLRHLCYEFFVVQHIATAALLLWVVYVHVPSYARYNVWFAIAALCLDRLVRLILLVWQNVKARPNPSRCKGGQRIGHQAQIRAVGDDITVVTIKDVHFRWAAGQHVYLWMPTLAPLEQHPYTVACAHQLPGTCICNSIQLVVRKHAGFSKRLHDRAAALQASEKKTTFTAFLTGPYGAPPRSDIYETLILISASTGASFTLPILESVLQARQAVCTKRVDFLLSAKKGDEIDYYVRRLHELIEIATGVGIELSVYIAVTSDPNHKSRLAADATPQERDQPVAYSSSASSRETSPGSDGNRSTPAKAKLLQSTDIEKTAMQCCTKRQRNVRTISAESRVYQLDSRPDIDAFIRDAVVSTGGETSVVVCGGKSLVAKTRNSVARLSDERAVHKGTGAQGIHLHVEEYGF
ncbi:ferric-chelate reductase [Grosmannia clavigera kw1407]|uniref:ferric-chelate reductase (NADPH) n=1 Tax=Grosmannia clavigera (strain kw1407 / UAMH 11150) TaxID=655863 RepID=F0XIB1_GROCL|nr:ferric-chelate reductase [Grosmannia clavigera kw1407]EFX02778.1 ferric-chelate reductase [Grosmannia clavigera kw1407]